MESSARRTIPIACALLSGLGALTLEVVWTRIGVLIFGTTTASATAVLSTFMAGLALGSLLVSRRPGWLSRPLRVYAIAELIVAILAALIAIRSRSVGLSAEIPAPLAVLLLLLPTTCMGVTLPVLIESVKREGIGSASAIGFCYGINTLGGSVGALIGGLWWVPSLGLSGASFIAALFLLMASGLALLGSMKEREIPLVQPTTQSFNNRKSPYLLLGLAAWGGASALSLEIVWTRVLSLILGPSVYAIGIVLFVYLFGIALGALVSPRLYRKIGGPRSATLVLVGLAAAVIWSAGIIGIAPYLFVSLVEWTHPNPSQLRWFELALSMLSILPGAFGHGLLLPLLISWAKGDQAEGEISARFLAANTAGAILGAAATGLFLIPHVGFFPILMGVMTLDAVLAHVLVFRERTSEDLKRPIAFAFLTAGILALFGWNARNLWDRAVLASGVYKYAVGDALSGRAAKIQVGDILFYREGISSTVAVLKTKDDRILSIDGKADASATGDQSTQVLLGALPLSLARTPEKVLVIGFASGVTAGTASLFPGARVTSVEIEPAVYDASDFFLDVNHGPLSPSLHPKIVGDARHFLLKTSQKFDVITSEPSNPWMSGVAPLFTKEFFSLAASKLSEGGVMCQWLPIYGMSMPLVASVLRTFRTVFSSVLVFESVDGFDLLLIGSPDPLSLDAKEIESRWQGEALLTQLKKISILSGADLAGRFLMGNQGIERVAGAAVINTDDNGYLEFRAPLTLHWKTADSNMANLLAASEGVRPYLSKDSSQSTVLRAIENQYRHRSRPRLAELAEGAQ